MDDLQWQAIATGYASLNDDMRLRFLHPVIEQIVLDHRSGRQSLLDYGAGPGCLAARLIGHFSRVVLCDISAEARDIATQRIGGKAVVLSPEQLSNSQEQFDVILFVLVLTTIADLDVLAQLMRSLRGRLTGNGILVVGTTHPCFTFRAISHIPYQQVDAPYPVPLGDDLVITEYHRPLDCVLNVLTDAGLRITAAREVYDDVRYFLDRGEVPPRFAGILPVFLALVCERTTP